MIVEPRCWILFQAKAEFKNEYELRDWLVGGLKLDRDGCYFLNRQFGVSAGSVILFERNGFLVGSAIAKEDIREPSREEKELMAKEGKGWDFVLRIIPRSIWAWQEPFVSLKDFKAEGLDIPVGGPQKEISTSDVLKIFRIVCESEVG